MFGFTGTREWVYPQSISGSFMRLRRATFFVLHIVLFVVPWIYVNGYPLVRVDIPTRRLYAMGAIFTASDTLLLLILLLSLAFSLFFFTAIFGRVWCGYACPQTVFLESWIRPLELWIEGERRTRQRRDAGKVGFDLVWRKVAKWTLFALVSLLLGMAIVSFFAGARELWTGQAGRTAYVFVALIAGAWFLDFVWFREQFCSYLCPYARFQSALADDESLIITYEEGRGEPREKGKAAALEGRCIDCHKCVVVCPQGIDIRNGFQLECIQCARCIDACTSVMEPLGHETLVAYGSVAKTEGRNVRLIRPRSVIYAGLILTLMLGGLGLTLSRTPFEATLNRAPGTLFTTDTDGAVRNTYLLRLTNKNPDPEPVSFSFGMADLPGATLLAGEVELSTNETQSLPVVVRAPSDALEARSLPFTVVVRSSIGDSLVLRTTFASGGRE